MCATVSLRTKREPLDGDVVGLRAGAGEDHLCCIRTEEFGDLFAGVLEAAAGIATCLVLASRV